MGQTFDIAWAVKVVKLSKQRRFNLIELDPGLFDGNTQEAEDRLHDARLSFLSGHASFSFQVRQETQGDSSKLT